MPEKNHYRIEVWLPYDEVSEQDCKKVIDMFRADEARRKVRIDARLQYFIKYDLVKVEDDESLTFPGHDLSNII